MPQQQVPIGLTLMEEVERTNAVMVYPNQRAKFAQYNPYTMNVDQGNINCYNYGGFGHLAKNCRNRGIRNRIGKIKRLEYGERRMMKGGNGQNNLNKEGNLIVFN